MRIGVDLDGVVYDFTKAFHDYYFQTHGRHLGTPTCWEFYDQPDVAIGLDGYLTTMRDGIAAGQIFRTGQPIAMARSVLEVLARDHEIVIVTHRSVADVEMECRYATMWWIGRWRIPHHQFVIAKDKTGLGLDVLLDDAVHNLDAANADNTLAVCYDQPWNADWGGARVSDWEDFFFYIKKLEVQ